MPKVSNFNFKTYDEDSVSETEDVKEISSTEPKVTEPDPIVKEKIEKSGKCKNPKYSHGFDDGDIRVTLFPDNGDECEFQVGNGPWEKYSGPFPICYEKATVQVQFKAVNPNKNDSDIIKVKLG